MCVRCGIFATSHAISTVSGCLWAAIGYFLGQRVFGNLVWGGVIASPLIGLAVGAVYSQCCAKSLWTRLIASIGTLYLAAALFGLAIGLSDAIISPNDIRWAVIVQAMNVTIWGITVTGACAILWPMAFLNHILVCRYAKAN